MGKDLRGNEKMAGIVPGSAVRKVYVERES